MSLDANLVVAIADDAIEFTIAVENKGPEPVDLRFRDGQVADVIVYREDVEVWRWSEDRLFTQALRTERVASGEAMDFEMTWADPSPGEYIAEGTLTAVNVTLRDRAVFEVP